MLPELLELLHTSEDRWISLLAEVDEWKDREGLQAAADRASSAFFGARAFARPPGRPYAQDDTGTEETSLSVAATSQRAVRVERPGEDGDDVLVVAPDGGILHVEPDGTATAEASPHRAAVWIRLGLLGPMLAPAPFAGACRLEPRRTVDIAGRECIEATAELREETSGFTTHLLGPGVRRAVLAVDRETGVVLRIVTTDDDGHPLHRAQFREVRFDVPFEDDLFSVHPPTGAVAGRHSGGAVTLQEAARQVPFTLLVPPADPADYPWSALVTPHRPGNPVTVFLHQLGMSLESGRPMTSLVESDDPAAMPDVTGWSPAGVDGADVHTWTGHDTTHLATWRDGTGIWIRDAETLDAAVQLLRSLQPVDGALPATT